jgi:hypothetical protein
LEEIKDGRFEREELQAIAQKASLAMDIEGTSPLGKQAYMNLIMAADHLDAMIARKLVGVARCG